MARNVSAIKRKYGANAFKRWGRKGGSPILAAWAENHQVKGYRVTHK